MVFQPLARRHHPLPAASQASSSRRLSDPRDVRARHLGKSRVHGAKPPHQHGPVLRLRSAKSLHNVVRENVSVFFGDHAQQVPFSGAASAMGVCGAYSALDYPCGADLPPVLSQGMSAGTYGVRVDVFQLIRHPRFRHVRRVHACWVPARDGEKAGRGISAGHRLIDKFSNTPVPLFWEENSRG